MEKEIKGDFEFRYNYWFSEWDNRPYHLNLLLLNGKNVLYLPTANRRFTIDEMIGMYYARQKQ